MLKIAISSMTGAVLGFLSGLGVGGGSLLILWLTLIQGVPQESARCINLMFFLPCALIASFFRRKEGSLNIKKLLPAILSGCCSALLLSWIGKQLDTEILKKGFGILLIVTGIRELTYKKKQKA